MKFRNIDLINTLIIICAGIDALGYGEECLCPECRSQSSEHDLIQDDFAERMCHKLTEAQMLLEKLSPEYIIRFEDYEIDYEDMVCSISYAAHSPNSYIIVWNLCMNIWMSFGRCVRLRWRIIF